MLYKRGNKWWVRFTARGREIRVTSGTDRRELAEEFEQRLREAIWREKALGQEVHTWEEACERWLKEKAGKRSLIRDRQAFAAIGIADPLVGQKAVVDLDAQFWRGLGELLDEGRKPGATNRILAVVRSVLRRSVTWGWLTNAPKIELRKVVQQDPRWITGEEFDRLKTELPPHAQAIASFAVYTGLRASNIVKLRWDACDLAQGFCYVGGSESKSGRAIGVPLSGRALRVLRGCIGNHPDYVFTDERGRAPIRSIKTTWGKAIKRAGLQGLRFHDLRHTWAAWHTLHGTSPIELKELGGWASLAMVERYSHLNPAHLAHRAGNARPYRSRHSGALMRPKRKK